MVFCNASVASVCGETAAGEMPAKTKKQRKNVGTFGNNCYICRREPFMPAPRKAEGDNRKPQNGTGNAFMETKADGWLSALWLRRLLDALFLAHRNLVNFIQGHGLSSSRCPSVCIHKV